MYRFSYLYLLLAGFAAAQGVSGLAEGILQETTLAQRAIADRDQHSAVAHVRQALANADAIQKQMPSDATLMVPVSKEIYATTTYRPVKPSKNDEIRLRHDSSIRGVEATTTTQSLNVSMASTSLGTAMSALEHDDWATAGSALEAVSKAVVQSQTSGEMPLITASQNLQLARTRVQVGKYRDAAVPLRAAADALAAYQRSVPAARAESVETVREQIAAYAERIAHQHDDVQSSISAWSGSIDQWRKSSGQ